jgi:tRNA threonylcarbamoyl adenosine modification protein YjeE
MNHFVTNNEIETKLFVEEFLTQTVTDKLNKNIQTIIICLSGDLGSGKTFVTSHAIKCLIGDASKNIPSPTFSLVNHYNCKFNKGIKRINHFDLYRITDPQELDYINFYDVLFDSINFIEWHQIAGQHINRALNLGSCCLINCNIHKTEADSTREISLDVIEK